MRNAIAGVVGLAFGLGLCLSGMNEPSKVLAFLDLAGDWDPSLAFLALGALIFGVGWGLGGLCPGPGIVDVGFLSYGAMIFVASMAVGTLAFRALNLRLQTPRAHIQDA